MKYLLLATATASDEVSEWWYQIAFGSFVIGTVLCLILLTTAIIARRRNRWFSPAAVVALLLGLLSMGFGVYLYAIDYVAVGGDGTKASGPIWQALWVPSLPVLLTIAAIVIYRLRTQPK